MTDPRLCSILSHRSGRHRGDGGGPRADAGRAHRAAARSTHRAARGHRLARVALLDRGSKHSEANNLAHRRVTGMEEPPMIVCPIIRMDTL